MPVRLPKHIWCFEWDSNPQILVPKTNAYASSATKAFRTFSAFCIYIISKILEKVKLSIIKFVAILRWVSF